MHRTFLFSVIAWHNNRHVAYHISFQWTPSCYKHEDHTEKKRNISPFWKTALTQTNMIIIGKTLTDFTYSYCHYTENTIDLNELIHMTRILNIWVTSFGMYNTQPSSPVWVRFMARMLLARPTSNSLNEKKGKALVDRSMSVNSDNTQRASGPAMWQCEHNKITVHDKIYYYQEQKYHPIPAVCFLFLSVERMKVPNRKFSTRLTLMLNSKTGKIKTK